MGSILHGEVVTLDTALKALALGNAGNINNLTLFEQVDLDFGAQFELVY